MQGCTDTDVTPKPLWRQRKEAYIRHVASASPSVRLVAAADKLHNARSILADYIDAGEALWDRFKGKRDGTLWFYRELVTALRPSHCSKLIDELDRVVTEIEHRANGGQPRKSNP